MASLTVPVKLWALPPAKAAVARSSTAKKLASWRKRTIMQLFSSSGFIPFSVRSQAGRAFKLGYQMMAAPARLRSISRAVLPGSGRRLQSVAEGDVHGFFLLVDAFVDADRP